MEVRPRELVFLESGGVSVWLDELELRDGSAYDMILMRLERVEQGNFGDCDTVGDGVSELRFLATGPGYRIYFGEHDEIVVLLKAGTKHTQGSDTVSAKRLWKDYKNG